MIINTAEYQELKNQINSAIIESFSSVEQTKDVADTIIQKICSAIGQEVVIAKA